MMLAPQASDKAGHLVINDVVKVYSTKREKLMAVDHCSLDIKPGEICMIVGPSGCGKTSLLNAVAGFHDITSGSITLDGKVLCDASRLQAVPGSDRVVVFQNGALFPWKTILDNLTFGPLMQGTLNRGQAVDKARLLLTQAGLSGCEDNYPSEISSGMRRRAEIARALMNNPAVLLLDEPYRALDALTRSVMHEALLALHQTNPVTIMFITHDLEEAVFLGHRVVVMSARPCRPRLSLDIDIPFPRTKEVLTSKRYREYVETALDAVHEEAKASFASGEREGS